MRVIIKPDYEAMSKKAAQTVADRIRKKPNIVLGLATGSTPLGVYRELVRMSKENDFDFSKVTTFNLDEYWEISPSHPQSYNCFMWDNLFSHVNVHSERVHIPSGKVEDVETYCRCYEEKIKKAGGIDLQILGIGRDGHIGFNEPGSSLSSRTRLKTLASETVEDNARFFKNRDEVPRYAITMGVGTIMEAKECILLASGKNKAEVVQRCIEGPVCAECTSSALQLHPKVIVIMDEDASQNLKRKEYYKYIEKKNYET